MTGFQLLAAYKTGKIILFRLKATLSGQFHSLGTINSKYTPACPLQVAATYEADGYNIPTYAILTDSRTVYVVNKGASGKETYVSGVYMIA